MDNEISVASGSMSYRDQDEWIQISSPPKAVISKTVGSYVELECEAMGSPPPNLQWLRGKTPLTEVRKIFYRETYFTKKTVFNKQIFIFY